MRGFAGAAQENGFGDRVQFVGLVHDSDKRNAGMTRAARWLGVIGASCAALPLAAQTPPADPPAKDAEIVVNGKTQVPSGGEVFAEARGISRIGPREAYVVALPRYWSPVCPGVAGLRADYAMAMIGRMRDTIARLEIPLAKEDCSPNLVVAFEQDGRTLLTDLQRDKPHMFQLVSQAEQAELLADQAPVRVWNNIAMRWTGAGPPPEKGVKASVWGQLNRNAMPESYDIVSALVVFDRNAVEGMTLTQLADYATMRGLSHTRPASGKQPMATILSLFGDAAGSPDELTSFDIGYLRSLYSWQANASAAHKLLDVQRWAGKAQKPAGKP